MDWISWETSQLTGIKSVQDPLTCVVKFRTGHGIFISIYLFISSLCCYFDHCWDFIGEKGQNHRYIGLHACLMPILCPPSSQNNVFSPTYLCHQRLHFLLFLHLLISYSGMCCSAFYPLQWAPVRSVWRGAPLSVRAGRGRGPAESRWQQEACSGLGRHMDNLWGTEVVRKMEWSVWSVAWQYVRQFSKRWNKNTLIIGIFIFSQY